MGDVPPSESGTGGGTHKKRMSVFTRFKDIVEANINAMLDKAENPQRMLRLMIQDMEDTLVEMKVSCAQKMADKANTRRAIDRISPEIDRWTQRAELALSKNREDMAREALVHRRQVRDDTQRLETEIKTLGDRISKEQSDIALVEEKLLEARDKLLNLASGAAKQVSPVETATIKTPPGDDTEIEDELRVLKDHLNNNKAK